MPLTLFEKIIGDLKQLDSPMKRLHLYKDGEPLLNRNLPQMVSAAKSANIAESIEITTNAIKLDANLATKLAQAGLDRIRISVQAVSGTGYRTLTGTDVKYDTFVQNLRESCVAMKTVSPKICIHAKTIDVGLTNKEKREFLDGFSQFCDEVHIDTIMGWSRSETFDFTLGRDPQTGMDSESGLAMRQVCPMAFYTLAVNFDGSVSVCCVDWAHETIVGNLNRECFKSIWNGESLREFRRLQLEGRRMENPACSSCQYIHGLPSQSNIDGYEKALLQYL